MSIDFLIIGHMTQDRVPAGFRPGGTVSYAAVTATRLGCRPGILTRAALPGVPATERPEGITVRLDGAGPMYAPLAGIPVHVLPSGTNTVFDNIYDGYGRRIQVIESSAGPILPADLPPAWAGVPLVLLGPLDRELPETWADSFPGALLGVTAQGWLRAWDEAGHIRPSRWENAAPLLARADAVIIGPEDVGGDEDYIAELAGQTHLFVVTDGRHGCTVYRGGQAHRSAPRLAHEVDPTGAGDIFAAAFLIRLAETGDPLVAARFANVVASMSVEAAGMEAIPYRWQVERWQVMHRDADLRSR